MRYNTEELNRLKDILNKYSHIINGKPASTEETVDEIVNYYDGVIACMPGNVYVFDKDLVPITCNQNVLDMLGYKSTAEFKKKTFEQMGLEGGWSKEAEQSFKKDTLEVIQTKKAKLNIVEPSIPDKNGDLVYFLSSRVPLFDRAGEVSGIVGISVDITELKKMSFSLQKALTAAEEASAAKTEFIRNMSHDIRTPLTGIIGMANIIEHQTPVDGAKDIREAGEALLGLLNEVIETVKLESGIIKHEKECFELKATIDALTAIYKPAIKQKGLTLETYYDDNIPKVIFGQELLLHRIILNLLGNAVKFTEKGSISLEASLSQKINDKVVLKIVVSDTGIGIHEDKKEIIFEQFSRLSSSYSNLYKGTGLGLYLVKEFIKKLGGDVKVNSVLDKGSNFICTVPFKIPSEAQLKKYKSEMVSKKSKLDVVAKNQEQQTVGIRKKSETRKQSLELGNERLRALLVEDTPLPRKAAENLLTTEGYEVVTAESVQEAIEQSLRTTFDLIYMDIGLPDGTGIEATKAIRQNPNNPNNNTYIVALTAHADAEIKRECLAVSMQDVFNKPLDLKKIEIAEINMNNRLFAKKDKVELEQSYFQDVNHLPVLDLEVNTKIAGGNELLAKEMLKMLIEQLPEFQEKITDAYHQQDWDALKHHVHKLHGGLCYSGAVRLKTITQNFEMALNKNTCDYSVFYDRLIQGIHDTKNQYMSN